MNQVVEQATGAEHGTGQAIVGNHRCLIDNEQGMLMQILVYREIIHFVGEGPLAIDLLVNGESGVPGIMRKDFGRPPSGSQQNTLLLKLVECLDQGTY